LTSIATASSSVETETGGGRVRAAVRLAGLGIWTAAGVVICLAVRAIEPLAARGWTGAARRRISVWWARGVVRLLGIRIRTDGPVPSAPFLMVANHLSYVDIPVLMATLPCRFVAKQEVRQWRGVGPVAKVAGTIFIDRTSRRDAVRVGDRLGEAVAGGDGVVVFAEATSSPGQRVLPFRPALLDWAARTGHPVHYASVGYRTPAGAPPAHLAVCWWGDMTFGPHLSALARLPGFEAWIHFGPAPLAGTDRKQLATDLHRAVTARFVPVVTRE
jgi:1-acyl-sn-glycerol-3-phosphate acyltransferase